MINNYPKNKIAYLKLFTVNIHSNESMNKVFALFDKDKMLPGIIILHNKDFFTMLSRNHFFEIMSKQYMLELFSKKDIMFFIRESKNSDLLILPSTMSVIKAAKYALRRDIQFRNDPIVVKFNNDYKLLDFYELLTAQTTEHLRALDQLEKANEFKKEVLGMIAHELKTPLNAIYGFSSFLRGSEDVLERPELKSLIDLIQNSARQMNDMLNEILELAIKDASKLELIYSKFDLNELLKQSVSEFSNRVGEKNQVIKLKNADSELHISADRNKIKEVIDNLISNALKYSPPSSEIVIESSSTKHSMAVFSVIDSGPGFSPEDLKKVFGKFHRLSAKPTGDETSTGLGLYIVKQIIDNHNGKITISNNSKVGSMIVVELPLNSEENN